ncbi:MAG: BNR-4 repeat-containing protein [Armatimonadota bacterium]
MRALYSIAVILVVAASAHAATLPAAARGAKTLLIQCEAGPLHLKILKRDLNIYEGEDRLVADLYGPLRQSLAHMEMLDDGNAGQGGGAGEYQVAETTVECPMAGVCSLQIRGSGDMVYGVEMSADKYVVSGEIFFSHGGVGGSIYFQPPEGEFTITGQAKHQPGVQVVPLLDAEGNTIARMDLASTDEAVTLEFEAAEREGLWELQVQSLDVTFEISGVEYWTADAGAWFEGGRTKWMLLPYRTARYLRPGGRTVVDFILRNSTGAPESFAVRAETDPGLQASVVEPDLPVALDADESVRVGLSLAADKGLEAGAQLQALVIASAAGDPQVITSSQVQVRIGESPVSQPLKMPIVLAPFRHEDMQFGYAPEYTRNEVYFGLDNRPYIRHRTASYYGTRGVWTLTDDNEWVERGFEDALRAAYADYRTSHGGGGFRGAKIAFDGQGGLYTLLTLVLEGGGRPIVLLFSPDDGRTWQVHELRGNASDIEQFTGHNALDIPPPVLTYETTAPHPARFCAHNDLWLYMPRRVGDRLEVGEPVKVAENVVGSCQHSGGPASSVSRDGRTHIVWGEVAPEDAPGVPTYVATYDHATGTVGEKVLLGHGPPVNDVHNVPAITMDSEGYLHVLIGAHGQPFQYTHSLQRNDAYGGWTEAEPILATGYVTEEGETGRQTYISLVCDADDTLHTAFRQWRRGVDEYHGGSNYAALSVQHRPRGGQWSDAEPLVIGAVPGYSIWYHKLTVDRLGDLWLSYSYWTNDETYQSHFPDRYHHRAVLVSRDGGGTWKLAETEDFLRGMQLFAQTQ